jgi:hypothetical protein
MALAGIPQPSSRRKPGPNGQPPQSFLKLRNVVSWVPAFAGMTAKKHHAFLQKLACIAIRT